MHLRVCRPLLLVLTALSQLPPSSGHTASPALATIPSILDLYVCHESAEVEVLDVHLEIQFKNQSEAAVYIPREMALARESIAADLQSALREEWEVPDVVSDALAGDVVRPLGRSDLIKIPALGVWREQFTTSVRVKRKASADDPTAVAAGVHYLVLELRALPAWAAAPTVARHVLPSGQLWVEPLVVAPLRVDTTQALLTGDCANSQIEWMRRSAG